ncbi:hypothetical protein [Clostridium sp. C105KSO13]|uniref:hypothetical protein n=1 Tax=Clostridium sp. C105KSO13 TaxID=1776045 RepID=UPI0007407496|nr:hypothetical protein [Clostridium sp. C105KSO13]CUX16072.1 hypothetical protein BN3456_00139 [Clostridium sp. C105KSO13]
MIKPNTQKYHLLELIGISGEFPADQLNRLTSPSYMEKLITDLKAEKLIRPHYRDKLRGYRLTKRAKDMLLTSSPVRFAPYLTGNTETNLIRSEVFRRMRLHQKAETYVTLLHAGVPIFPDEKPKLFSSKREAIEILPRSLPLFYSSREIKELGCETTKIKNSRSVGILLAPHCVYAVYNTGSSVLKWEYKTEVRLNAFLQYFLQGRPYPGLPKVRAIMLGTDMHMALRLMTSTGGYKKSLFMLDTAFEHFHYLPNTPEGEALLRILLNPQMMSRLKELLLSDLEDPRDDIPIEHDAVAPVRIPVLLAYDFDMQRINRFNTGLNVYGLPGSLICFDFQIPCLKEYLTADIQFHSIDLFKFKKGFLHEH